MTFIWKSLKFIRKIILYQILRLETYGARFILFKNGKFLLVKHPYDNYWVLPGGGMKKNEDPLIAATRELLEETRLKATGEIKKLGLYKNFSNLKRDYVNIYTACEYEETDYRQSILDKMEIQEMNWFSKENLPKISDATQRRIDEFLSNQYQDTLRDW